MPKAINSKLCLAVTAITENDEEFVLVFGENTTIKDVKEILEEEEAVEVLSLGWAESRYNKSLSISCVESHAKDFTRSGRLSKPIGRGLEAFF